MSARAALLTLIAAAASAVAVQAQTQEAPGGAAYAAFLAELSDPGAQFVVLSNHHRHDVGCTSRGCILMGPTQDREACEEWAAGYNTADPFDHARCVDADPYISPTR